MTVLGYLPKLNSGLVSILMEKLWRKCAPKASTFGVGLVCGAHFLHDFFIKMFLIQYFIK